jgi:uncharacterized protein DUF2795
VNAQRVNEIQVLLEGVPLPATRAMLVEYAASEDRDAAQILQQRLPDQEYDRIDEVGELLLGKTNPPYAPPQLPVPESGKPPGGDDYLRPFPQPGAVRKSSPKAKPQSKILEEQSKTQKKQKAKQDG